MYGRQQQPAHPRQYNHGVPQQGYPPPQQQQQQQYAQQYPPQQGYPRPYQQAPYQQPPPPAHGGQYGASPPGHGPYGHHGGAPPPPPPYASAAAPPRGPAYSGRVNLAAQSSYESQAQKWKQGFTATSGGGGSSRQAADIEAPLIAELCSPLGSSYPPREVLQKLLRHLPSLDHQYLCDLLDDKLEDPIWQVQGKALSVLDALFKSTEAEVYKNHYYNKAYILETLCRSKKELLKARAEKIASVVCSHVPPAPPAPPVSQEQPPQAPAQAHQPPVQQEEPSLLSMSPVTAPAPAPPVNLLGSPLLMGMDEPADAPSSSAFGFLNSSAPTPSPQPTATPAAPPQQQQQAPPPPSSAFSFLSQQLAPTTPPVATPQSRAPVAVDIFSSLPPPTPVAGLAIPQEPTPPPKEEEAEEPPVHDPIHDAFEGLNFDDDEEEEMSPRADGDNPLAGFSTTSRGTMGRPRNASNAVPIKIDPSDPTREVVFEIDVPAGPMGLMLDRSIPHMAVVQGFLPMPTGEKGYLEMHPVLCPGCALVAINAAPVDDKPLDDVGAMLGSLIASYKVLKFKKLTRSGRIVNPAKPDFVYAPPPPEPTPQADDVDDKEHHDEDDGEDFMARLTAFSDQLADAERQLDRLVAGPHLPGVDIKNQLAQLHGTVEKIQTLGIDAVILGANPPPNADEIRQRRSALVRRADALTKRIQYVVAHGADVAPPVLMSPRLGDAGLIGSPEASACTFVGAEGPGAPPANMPPLQLPPKTNSTSSAFSFLQASTASPVASPVGAATSGSAFSFLSGPPQPTPAPASTAVFAGLNLHTTTATPPPPTADQPSAFGFLSGTTPTSPTAFSFLQGGVAPSSPPVAAAHRGSSAFSFIG